MLKILKKRKDYVQKPDLLMAGVDVSKVKHDACMGTLPEIICRKLGFTNTRDGFKWFEDALIE